MRILVVQDTDWVRRGPHQQHHIFEGLAARGHKVSVVDFPLVWRSEGTRGLARGRARLSASPKTGPAPPLTVDRPGFVQLPGLDLLSYAIGVKRVVRDAFRASRPDVVVGHGILADRAASHLARASAVPYVAHWLDALDQLVQPRWARGLARRIMRANLARAAKVVVINGALARYAESLGARPGTLEVIPAGVDLARYRASGARERKRQALGIAADELVLGFIGWLYDFSGVDVVARDLLQVPTGRRISLLVVGDGDLLPALKELAAHPTSQGRLRVLGRRPFDEMPELLAAMDVGLLPSMPNETMNHIVPIKVYEYLAAGLPVVATRLPGVEEEFRGQTAFTFVAGPAGVIPAVLDEGFQPQATERRREAIRATVQGQAWETSLARFEAVLEHVVERHGKV